LETGPCIAGDIVEVTVTVTDIGGGISGFSLTVDGNASGNFPYEVTGTTVVSIEVPGDGQAHTIEVTDIDDPTCTALSTITTTNCVIPCQLTNLAASQGTSTIHAVEVQDFQFQPQHITITSGDIVEYQWTGQVEHTSTSDATTGPDSWDSGLMGFGATFQTPVLIEGIHPYYCIPHGAPGGVGMSGTITVQADCTNGEVNVLITFNETGGGFGGYNVLVDGVEVTGGPYAYDVSGANTQVIPVSGDGASHTITVRDADDPTCEISTTITTPDCNASVCMLNASATIDGECDENGFIPININIDHSGTGSGGFQVLIDGILTEESPYNYDTSGSTIIQESILGDGLQHTILVVDLDNPDCISGTNIELPDCSVPCQIFSVTASTGIPSKHIVEVRDFSFHPQHLTISVGDTVEFQWTGSVAHTSTSDATNGANSWDSGLLEQGAKYQVVLTSAGIHPYYCIPHGGPGGIGMSGTITALGDCENGQVPVQVSFVESGGSLSGYYVLVDGDTTDTGLHSYSPSGMNEKSIFVPGDGFAHTISIQDNENQDCNASVSITTPDCNAVNCSVSATAQISGACDGMGKVLVDVAVTSFAGSASGFHILIDGIIQDEGPYMYDPSGTTNLEVLVEGNNAEHHILIVDIEDANCIATANILTPNCEDSCNMSGLEIQYNKPVVHIIEVRDFDFMPTSVSIFVGDTVRFIWTGDVDHTSTSDATSGPDTWNSGLLSTGAIFDVLIQNPGQHPYYCIPHGAPGGIGMAATITALDICEEGQLPVEICFDAMNSSALGYQVILDQQMLNSSPLVYNVSGPTCTPLILPGDGAMHLLEIVDIADPECSIDTFVLLPDCTDACFGFEGDFTYDLDLQTQTVSLQYTGPMDFSAIEWSFGDGQISNDQNPTHQFDSTGIYTICLQVQNALSCTDTICREVNLNAFECIVDYSFTTDGLNVFFQDESSTSIPIEDRIWTFGDGEVAIESSNPTHLYDSLGLYQVCLTIQADSCISTLCKMVDLTNPCLVVSADFSSNQDVSGGFQFEDLSSGSISSWLWGFGDGSISSEQNPYHTYESPGIYTVCLLIFDIMNNCTSYQCGDLEVLTTAVNEPLPKRAGNILISPNPASVERKSFTIRGLGIQDLGKNLAMRIYSLTGTELGRQSLIGAQEVTFHLRGNYVPAMYVVEIKSDRNVYIGKLVLK
jgi:plastocyanin/PKD repeat protein